MPIKIWILFPSDLASNPGDFSGRHQRSRNGYPADSFYMVLPSSHRGIYSRNPRSACFFPGQPHRNCFSTLQAGASGSGDEKCGCLRVNRHHAHQARGGERASHRPVLALPGVLLPDVHGHGSGRRFPGNIGWGLSRVQGDTRCPSTHLLFRVLCLVAALRRMCFVSDGALLPCHI